MSKTPKKPPQKQTLEELRAQIDQEIKDHSKWCSARCQTFLPSAYRKARIVDGHSDKLVQKDYDLCHASR